MKATNYLIVEGAHTGQSQSGKEEAVMQAKPGDRLILEGIHVGARRRTGVVLAVPHADGSPPYTVRWLDNGHEALVFPGTDARVEPPTDLDRGVNGHDRR